MAEAIKTRRGKSKGALTLPLYTEGAENVVWVNGFSYLSTTRTKEAGDLKISVSGGTGHFVTDATVDLTPFTKLYVDYDAVGSGNVYAGFMVSSEKLTEQQDASYGTTVAAARSTKSIDISSINSSKYIKLYCGNSSGTVYARFYKIWLE
jgi:hypothetical protein